MTTRHAKAFTLIELLVVIAIIAILIGILLPSLGAARESAKSVRAMSAARSLMLAYTMYADDHDGFVLPAHLTAAQAASGVRDEMGNEIYPPVSQRWVYRLGPYFDHGWAGTTHIDNRADLLSERSQIMSQPNGAFLWSYEVSVFPSFGINRRYVGGDYRRSDWIDQKHHVRRATDAFQPSGLLVFATARFYVGSTQVDGYIEVDPPPLGASYDETLQTNSPATAFGNVHPRYGGRAIVGWFDGHTGGLSESELLDRRNWSNSARRAGDANWEP